MVSGDRKLRAACDRCHELKNRCTRTGGLESRCDRCERLDIDCVYNNTARLGRPRVSRPMPENQKVDLSDSHSHSRHSKRRAIQRGPTTVSLPINHDPAYTATVASAHNRPGCAGPKSGRDSGPAPGGHDNLEPVPGLLPPILLSEVIPGDNLNWDLGIHGHPHQRYNPVENPGYQFKAVSDFSDSGLGVSEQGTVFTTRITGADKLLWLQSRLGNMLKCAIESPTEQQPAVDKVLSVCKELLELILVPDSRLSSNYSTAGNHGTEIGSPSFAPGSVNAGHPDRCHGLVATLYAYALQLLDLAVDNLKAHAGNLALISFGSFNLASQPAMSTSVGAYMVSSMVHQLRDAVHHLIPEYQQQKGPPPAHGSVPSGSDSGAAPANSVMQTAVNMVSQKEASVLEKSAQIIVSP
ncbi:hypothetical protein BDV25DRAFT_127720 [Aspergillus avenaceus]|uniref:Zn(2)-C6 fungal-type domain-containing protein n=1 Tax=Aspergillus avenaceus TaxID=36643 RepID=A0A5N6U274_ASPAV|nr:hypothetical protein BDV25DRAFT_127720 [Aspergillus avenaceus]